MKIKLHKCECVYALYPFGNGMPVCIRDRVIAHSEEPPLKECKEKGCKYYESFEKKNNN